jgi:8-amino-7-oxononanoate synthase
MKMDVAYQNSVENFIISNPAVRMDRRSTPRYPFDEFSFPVPIIINNSPLSNYRIVFISMNGISIECTDHFKVSDRLDMTIHLPDSNVVQCNGRVVWQNKKELKNQYGIDIYYFRDNIDVYKTFISSLGTGKAVDDRRKGERRTKNDKDDSVSVRKFDRRLTKSFFIKCLRYNRMKDLMNKGHYFYMREQHSGALNKILRNGKELINFSSNNYLGLATHPALIEAAIQATEKYGVSTAGSRVLSGTNDLHTKLEKRLADFKGGEDCIVFPTGYSTNLGVLSALVTSSDYVLLDSKSHASIIDGCVLGGAKINLFKHNDMQDLEKKLGEVSIDKPKLILTEGIFSMDGDLGKIDEIYELSQKYDAAVFVDDAHATGVLGKKGKGSAEYFNLDGKIDIVTGTLTKALGCLGGFVVTNRNIVHYLKHNSRSFIFSTSLPPAICAALIKAIDIIEENPEIVDRLRENSEYVIRNVTEMGYHIGPTESPIIPIVIGDEILTYKMTGMLEESGIYASPVAYPAVKRQESRLRISLMATHTKDDLDCLVFHLKRIGKELGII